MFRNSLAMESGSGAANEGVLVPLATKSDTFLSDVLAPLESSYLYEESKQSFRYTSAVLIKNAEQEKKYNAFRMRKRELGYTEKDLKESYGFLLFSDINKAEKLGETGIQAGNSTCKTLGDPTKGVYISQYSDRLDQNPWSHGKSGYVAIIKLTKGRVREVSEKFTQNVTAPTKGFDCHVSKEFSTVISSTSSFLAFQRTQCYLYEFLGDGSDETVQCPSAARLYAIVAFSYVDPNVTHDTLQQRREHKDLGRRCFLWRGQLNIGSCYYSVGLRAAAGAVTPAQLPTVVKVDRVVSLSDLRRVLPKAIFQTRFSSEVVLSGLCYSFCELVSSEEEQTSALDLLLQEIKAKDVALTVPLNDSGFLILLPSSYFCPHDSGSSPLEFLQGIFVFPDSRVINRDIFPSEVAHRNSATSPEILQVLPVPSYAEGAVGRNSVNPDEKLSEVFEQHMQNYTPLINPGAAASPPTENGVISERYQAPDADSRLGSFPEMTSATWQNLTSYLQNPVSFQLPVSKASDILSPRPEQEVKDIVDSVNLSMLSPEEVPASHVDLGSVGCLTRQNSTGNRRSVDGSAEGQGDLKTSPQRVKLGGLLIETGDMERKTSPSSDDLRAELIVSITSAEPTRSGSEVVDTEPSTKRNAFQQPGFQPEVSAVGEEPATALKVLESPKKVPRGNSKGLKRPPRERYEMGRILTEDQILRSQHSRKDVEASDQSQLHVDINSSRPQTHKLGRLLKNKKLKYAVGLTVVPEKKSDRENVRMEMEAYSLRRKMEHWDLKPVISKCGRILVPHGSGNISEQIKHLRNAAQSESDMKNVVDECKTASDIKMAKVVETSPKGEERQHRNLISHVRPAPGISQQQDDELKVLLLKPQSSRNIGATAVPLPLSPEKPARRMETLINKLKSVLGGKRKPEPSETVNNNPENAEICRKRGKFEARPEFMKSADETEEILGAGASKEGVSTLLSADPRFAFALGLAPIAISNKMVKSEAAGVQQRKDPAETKEATASYSLPQILQRPLSIFPRSRRMKTLRRHQSTSAESVKEKWWLHFQSPPCLDEEDDPDRGASEQRSSSSATDGLNLLADLALCATSDQPPNQPNPPERVLKNLSCKNADGVAEEESVLHALLRQPAARPIQQHQSPPPVHHVGGGELAGLITKEHAYSMHPSTSLLLGFSSMSFQIYPLSGCTRLLQALKDDPLCQTQHLSVDQEEKSNQQAPECTEKHTLGRRFRRSRTFTIKDGSVQVTKHWKRNYDFGLDSKFSNDPQFRSICRALHGPWDFSVKDTSDDVRLIFHMWIALFYSRSMPRFFDFDSDPCSGSVSPPHSDIKDSLLAPDPNVKDTSDDLIPTPVVLAASETSTQDQSFIILDLSQKNSLSDKTTSVSQVIPKETCETLNTPLEQQAATPIQCYRNLYTTEMNNESNIRSTLDGKSHSILQRSPFHPDTDSLGSSTELRRGDENTDMCLLDSKDKEASDEVLTESGKKESPSHEVSVDPTQIQADLVSSGVVDEGDLLGKEESCVKEPDLFSPVKAEGADEDVDRSPSRDSVSKDLYPKEDSSPYQRADLNDQLTPMMSDTSDSVERGSVTDENRQTLQDICSADVQHQQFFQLDGPDMRNESDGREDASQQRKCEADEPHYEKAALIVSHEHIGLLDRTIPQANTDKTQDQSGPAEELDCSPKCDQTGERLDMIDSEVSFPEEPTHQEGAAPSHDPQTDSVVVNAEGQKEVPFISETATSQPADTQKATCMQRGEPELLDARMSPSLYDERCPTPTVDEEPYQYTPSPGPHSSSTSSTSTLVNETPKSVTWKCPIQTSTLLKNKRHLDKKYKTAVKSDSNPKSAPRVLQHKVQHKDKFLSAQKHTDKYSQIQVADEKHCLQRGKKQAGKGKPPSQSSRLTNECLQTFKPTTGNDGYQKPPRASVEMPSRSQSLVKPAKRSKGDETRGPNNENSKFTPTKTLLDLKTSRPLKKSTDLKEDPDRWQDEKGTSKLCTTRLSNVNKSNSGRTNRLLHQFNRGDTSEFKRVVRIVGKEPRGSSEIDQELTDASSSGVDYSCSRGRRGSVRCTIFNTSQKTCPTFLEKMSKRCLQEDLTEASVGEECLIFSEQMKQVLRGSKEGSSRIWTPAARENIRPFLSSSAAAPSCYLQDQEDPEVRLDSPSFVGLKIIVDLSDRKSQTCTTKEEIRNSVRQDGVSGVMAGSARPYTRKMGDVGVVRKCPVRSKKDIGMDSGRIDPSDLPDLCDILKRESFHKNLNLDGKRWSETKFRFYIVVTSDDPFFEETKVRLEAEGHTAVRPSEFFLVEESPSTLLIILRNEDIAEHICEVPYLLSLKKFPGVQFVGLDEPDDVLNQTHQELFVRGGFIMFDRAALESLKLCDMEMVSGIIQELSRCGRWKWIFHYRHSRWLKEKSRLSAEAREKKNFISRCQEAGIVEVLPYHQCDHLSEDQPDYLTCLVHLQVQNVSARYPIFITDTTNSSFGTYGILTLTLSSFLMCKSFQR
eukprot:XP_011605821.1 PREDICTED: protein FAM208B isoform X2 [Takifugu rubripes]